MINLQTRQDELEENVEPSWYVDTSLSTQACLRFVFLRAEHARQVTRGTPRQKQVPLPRTKGSVLAPSKKTLIVIPKIRSAVKSSLHIWYDARGRDRVLARLSALNTVPCVFQDYSNNQSIITTYISHAHLIAALAHATAYLPNHRLFTDVTGRTSTRPLFIAGHCQSIYSNVFPIDDGATNGHRRSNDLSETLISRRCEGSADVED